MNRDPSISVVIGAHNEVAALRKTVSVLVDRLQSHPGSEIIVVENGSTDRTYALALQLAEEFSDERMHVTVAQSPKGLGNAIRTGIALAQSDLVLLTAADLPFGVTDLDQALALEPRPMMVIGSKAHPESVVHSTFGRRVMSFGFRVLRRWLLHIDVGDTQGTFLIDRRFAQQLSAAASAEGYFITTELVVSAVRAGHRPLEVPVVYTNPRDNSKVRPLQDSWKTFNAMLALRARLRRSAAPARDEPCPVSQP